MKFSPNSRRLLYVALALLVVVPCAGYLSRVALAGWAFRGALEMAGADEIKFRVANASPWRVVFEDLDFRFRTQPFAAGRVALERTHWWQPSIGVVKIEAMRLPLTVDGSDTKPWAWSSYQGGESSISALQVPLEKITIDGEVIVQAAALDGKNVRVKFEAQQGERGLWQAKLDAQGEGLGVEATGTVDQSSFEVNFDAPKISVDLAVWQKFIHRMVLLPGGPWEMGGQVTASAHGQIKGKEIATQAVFALREGRAKDAAGRVDATGIQVDLVIDDVWAVKTRPGTLRIQEVRSGKLALFNADVEFALETAEKIVVSRATLQALGGNVTTEPFNYFPNLRELEVTVSVDDISVEQVMALTEDLPATASGRVKGYLPLSIDDTGVRLGTGWLEMKQDTAAEVQLHARGLLTGGVSKNSPSYAVLNKIESGLLRLRMTELRLDIRPPNAPPGRSAQLRIKGEPTDPEVKAPVNLDLNVNGPIESLINLSLKNDLKLGTKP